MEHRLRLKENWQNSLARVRCLLFLIGLDLRVLNTVKNFLNACFDLLVVEVKLIALHVLIMLLHIVQKLVEVRLRSRQRIDGYLESHLLVLGVTELNDDRLLGLAVASEPSTVEAFLLSLLSLFSRFHYF